MPTITNIIATRRLSIAEHYAIMKRLPITSYSGNQKESEKMDGEVHQYSGLTI